jgi:hypothetical protein
VKNSKTYDFSAMRKYKDGRFSAVKKSKVIEQISGFVMYSLHKMYKMNVYWKGLSIFMFDL